MGEGNLRSLLEGEAIGTLVNGDTAAGETADEGSVVSSEMIELVLEDAAEKMDGVRWPTPVQ